ACDGPYHQVRPCVLAPAQDCQLSEWGDWAKCSTLCGGGMQVRARRIAIHRENGGSPCSGAMSEAQMCNDVPCSSSAPECELSDWGEWKACDGLATQTARVRAVLPPEAGGVSECRLPGNASAPLQEIKPCTPNDNVARSKCELSLWSEWGACSGSCSGQRSRSRGMLGSLNDGLVCELPSDQATLEVEPCGEHSCLGGAEKCELSDWADWSPCSRMCGEGMAERSRSVTRQGPSCAVSLKDVKACSLSNCTVVDCKLGDWEQWGTCTTTCGGGLMERKRGVASLPRHGGRECEAGSMSEAAACGTQPCRTCIDGAWGQWGNWSACTGSCSPAYRVRRREVEKHPNECGKHATGLEDEYGLCAGLPPCKPDRDCELSAWSEWSACSSTCRGTRQRNRNVKVFQSGEGRKCNAESLQETSPCSPGPGEDAPEGCRAEARQSCQLAAWSPWGDCSQTCGGGQAQRSRFVLVPSDEGGEPCSDSLSEVKKCLSNPCNQSLCQDCEWEQWSDWSECPASSCAGQKYRRRAIRRAPNFCGRPCNESHSKETAPCDSTCAGEGAPAFYCAWSGWADMGGCVAECGATTRLRSRNLQLLPAVAGNGSALLTAAAALFASPGGYVACSGAQTAQEHCLLPPCDGQCEPVDCVFSDWKDWGAATDNLLCERQRDIVRMHDCGGKLCSGSLSQTERCTEGTAGLQDCVLSDWSAWEPPGACEANTQRSRKRTVELQPAGGGRACEAAAGGCRDVPADGARADCQLGPWGEWSAHPPAAHRKVPWEVYMLVILRPWHAQQGAIDNSSYSSYVVCDGCSRWRYCKNITSRGDLCICGKNLACLVPDGHVFRDDDGGWLAAQPQGGTSPRISWADGWQPGGGAGGKGQGGQRQPPPHDKTVDLKAAAAAAYSELSKDDPLRQYYEALWPELAAAKPPADQPVVGFKAVEAAARRLDKLQKKVRSAGEQVESAQQYLAESERKLREAMEASIAAEDEFDKLKATVGKQEAPAEPAAEKPTLAALLEQFEHEPDDFHKWSEPDKEVWRAAKAKGERMAQTVKEHEEETAKHLRLLEEETARHQEQLRQLEQVPPHALRQQGQPPRLRPPAPQQLPNQKQAQQNMTKQKKAEPEWRPTSRRRERRSRRLGAPRQSSTQKGRVTTQQGSRPKASAKKARRPCRIDFFNVTTWGPQVQGYLMEINNTKDRDIIGIAEHHLRQPAQISKARAALRRNGTHSYWTKARPGEGEGTRGGTRAITRGSLDIQDRIAGLDEHYLHEDGSDVTVVISNLHKVRFAVAFVYLECGTGSGERNADILCDLREKMAVWGEARCIDFALISQGLAPYFDQLELPRTAPWKPHIGIRLKLKGRPLMLKGRVLRRPAAIEPPVTVERMPKSRAACRRAARGGQEAMRRRQQALAEAGCDLDENDMEPVPQLHYDKEVQHVIPDELRQATSERASVRAYDELPQHLQHTVVGKMMERDMLDLGPPSYKSASIKDTVTSTPWAGVERKIHAWWAEISSLARQLSHRDARAQEAAASRQGKTQALPDEDSGGGQGPSAPELGPVMSGSQVGRNTMDIQDHDPFEDEEDYLEYRQEIADQENSDGYHQHIEGQQDSFEFGQTETADQEDCDGHHQIIEGQQDSIDYGPEAEEPRDMGLPPPDLWIDDQHQREREDYVAMRDDLEYWAAIWMDNLVQLPTDNGNWMQICVPFMETILGGGGNSGMVGLLRRRYQQVRTHSGHQTQQQINTRRQLAQQLNQPGPGRLNEEGAAKDQQQALLTDLHAIAEGALVDPGTISRVAEEVKSMAKLLTKAVEKAYIYWVHDATAGSAKMAHAYTKAAERSHLEDTFEHEGQVINHPQQLVDLRKEAWQRRWTRDAQKAERIQEALAKLRQAALAQENALEPISRDIIGSIIQHLKRNAGQGADWWRAPELKAMGAQGLEDFVQCLTSCEQRAAWPWQFYLALELLLGKKPGIGCERPIGLMPMPYRIWSAARRPIVATWSKAAAGFWDTAVAGSSALRVAMHRLMRAEAATEMGFHAAGVFDDAANFYDNIGLDQLIEKASAFQCPLLPLAMAVQMYIAPRAIMAHSLFSDIFEPANSMVAGCGQAVDLTRPLLHGILDAAHRHHIFVVMQQYLDDLALQVEGARRQVIDQIKHVAALVHDGFKQLSIPISVKTAVVASDKDLQAEVASILDSLGTPTSNQV
ncbi:unnamed protein product, partial [Prorocentrum cordatum]